MALPIVTPLAGDRLPFRSVLNPGSSLYNDLGALGYVEEEHLVTGDGYVTRVLVRRPLDGWSGTAVLEPFHVLDEDTAHWTTSWRHLTRRRHAWIGATVASGDWGPRGAAPSGGAARLRREQPDRYGTLSLPDEPEDDELRRMGTPSTHAHAVLADVAAVLKRTTSLLPLPARHVIGAGWSQTGLVWSHHLDHSHPTDDLDAVWIAVAPPPTSAPLPVVHVMSECELLGLLREPGGAIADAEDPPVRGYEVPGTFHYWQLKAHRGDQDHATRHNDRPWWLVAHALLDHLDHHLGWTCPTPRTSPGARAVPAPARSSPSTSSPGTGPSTPTALRSVPAPPTSPRQGGCSPRTSPGSTRPPS
jgi:hypothetical protein